MERLTGWKRRAWSRAAVGIFTVVTGGLVWIFVDLVTLWTLKECSLKEAQYVLASLEEKQSVLSEVWHITSSSKQDGGAKVNVRLFKLLLCTYVYDDALGTFVRLSDLPSGLPMQLHLATEALQAIEQGAEWTTLNPSSIWPRRTRAVLYGPNDMSAGRPRWASMAAASVTHPMYLIQYIELAYTLYEGYYVYAAALLATTLLSGVISTRVSYLKRLQLYNSVAQHQVVPLVQHGRVRATSSHRLVPGDVVVVTRGKATCDMVLLQGNCLVEESILSGEAAQVRKVSFAPASGSHAGTLTPYSPDTHQACSVFAGTYVQQVWNENAAEEEVLALVTRTGLHTSMGTMLRQVMTPNPTTDPFVKDLYYFCSFALVLQLAIFSLYITKAKVYHQSTADVIRNTLDTLVAAVPCGIPAVVIYTLWRCTIALRRAEVEVHSPYKVKTAAAVEVVVLDKTGTLTGSLPGLRGMLPIADGRFTELQQNAVNWPNILKQCAAACNSLNLVNKQKVVGEVADYTAFKACEACFLDRSLVALPLKLANQNSATQTTLELLKRFEFESQLLRSAVLVVDSAAPPHETTYFVRGAPAAIEQLVGSSQVPADYHQVVDEYSAQSFRLLALAKGVVTGLERKALSLMSQEQVEEHVTGFQLLGLLVLSNHLRPDSKDTITQLQQHAGLRCLMATGDYHHTALAVARGVGMIPSQSKVIIVQKQVEAKPADLVTDLEGLTATSPSQKLHQTGSVTLRPSALKPVPDKHALPSALSRQFTHNVSFAAECAAANDSQEAPLQRVQDTFGPAGEGAQQQVPGSKACQTSCQLSGSPLLTSLQNRAHSSHTHGLVFHTDGGSAAQLGAMEALAAIAQGEAQCCITGAAFEHMLHLGDQSLLESVMRNVVVFSRMKSHQKGQVMDLLGSTGLHLNVGGQQQHLPGLGKTCLYCGDGINDLLALARADVGVSIGASDAAAAASFSTKRNSVAGLALLLKECRAAQVTKLAAIRYMVLYQLVLTLAFNVCFFVDGSQPSKRQRGVLDFMALSLGVLCSLRPAKSSLTRQRPEQSLCMVKHIVILTVEALMLGADFALLVWYMTIQPWYTGGNGTNYQVYTAPSLTFDADAREFCVRIWLPIAGLMIIFAVFSTTACLVGVAAIDQHDLFGFFTWPWDFRWKTCLLGYAFGCLFWAIFQLLRYVLERCELRRKQHHIMPNLASSS